MFEEDLSAFFDKDGLGDQFVIQKNGLIIEGIIENEYVEINEMSGQNPVLTCASADLVSLERGDVIEFGSKQYRFILEEPDGTGVSRAILEAN